MLSFLLAMTAILAIAVANLALGFACAVLIGHGPQSLSDVDAAVRVCRFRPRLTLPRLPRFKRPGTVPSPGRQRGSDASDQAAGAATCEAGGAASPRAALAGIQPHPIQHAAPRMVLTPRVADPVDQPSDPVAVLTQQLAAWQAAEAREAAPCLSGFEVVAHDPQLDANVRSLLYQSVRVKVIGQLRKDRRVLRIADQQFIWFSPDAHVDDVLRPVERIRQLFEKTRFRHGDAVVTATVYAAIVAATDGDLPQELLQRLDRALALAREAGVSATCVDRGDGPLPAEPQRLEIEPCECVLA